MEAARNFILALLVFEIVPCLVNAQTMDVDRCAALLEATEDRIADDMKARAPTEDLLPLAHAQVDVAIQFLNHRGTAYVETSGRSLEIVPDTVSPLGRFALTLERRFGWNVVFDPIRLCLLGGGAAADPDGHRLIVAAYNLTRPGFRNAIVEHEIEHIVESDVRPRIESFGDHDLFSPHHYDSTLYGRFQRIDECAAYRRSIYRGLKVLGRFLARKDEALARKAIDHLKIETGLARMVTGRNLHYLNRAIEDRMPFERRAVIDGNKIKASLVYPDSIRLTFDLSFESSVDLAAETDRLIRRYQRDSEITMPLILEADSVLTRMNPEQSLVATELPRRTLLRSFWRTFRKLREANLPSSERP